LTDAAEALRLSVALDQRHVDLVELMDGRQATLDRRRAFVDVTTADVPGIVPPAYRPVSPIPALPLFALAEPLPETNVVLAGSLEAVPTATLDPAEKAAYGGGKITVSPVNHPVHVAAAGADLSLAIWKRSEPPLQTAFANLCAISVYRALETGILADLVAGSTTGTGTTPADVVAALAHVAAAYAPGNLVIAGSNAFAKLLTAYPLGLGDPDSPTSWGANVLPVADPSFADKALVSNRANVHVIAGPLRSLVAGVPLKLGIDVGIYVEGVGHVDVKAGAIILTLA
jgi:hypothetical protein